MPDKERLQVYDAIMAYGIYGSKTKVGGLAQMALNLVYNDIDDSKQRRKEKAEKARESAYKRWQGQNTNASETMRTHANAYERMQSDATQCYNVNVNGDGDVNVNGVDNPLTPLQGEKDKTAKKQKSALNIEPIIAELPQAVQDIVRRWVDYKKTQFRFTYKSEDSFKAWLKDLYKKSNGNIDTMSLLVEEAISHSWQGIYELKNQKNNANNEINFDRICQLSDAMLELERQQRSGTE